MLLRSEDPPKELRLLPVLLVVVETEDEEKDDELDPEDPEEEEVYIFVDLDPILRTIILEAFAPSESSTSTNIGKYPFLVPVFPLIASFSRYKPSGNPFTMIVT